MSARELSLNNEYARLFLPMRGYEENSKTVTNVDILVISSHEGL